MKDLIQAGADVNSKNKYDNTAVMNMAGVPYYNKKGDDGCFFYGAAGNSKAACTDTFDDDKRVHNPN